VQVPTDAVAVLQQRHPPPVPADPRDPQGERGLLGEAGRQGLVDLPEVVESLARPGQRKDTLHVRARSQRQDQHRTEPGPAVHGGRIDGARVGRHVLDREGDAGAHHDARERRLHRQGAYGFEVDRRPRDHLEVQVLGIRTGDDPRRVRTSHLAGAVGHRLERTVGGRVVGQQGGDLGRRAQPRLAPLGHLVEHGVLDRHPRRGGQRDRDGLVHVAEVLPSGLLREVEVAEDPAPRPDRHSQERRHRGVVVGEAVGGRVGGDVRRPDRSGVVDQESEQAVPGRQVADPRDRLLVQSVVDERAQPPVRALGEDAEGRVAGADEGARRPDDALQHPVQRELRRDGHHRVQQVPEPVLLVEHAVHAGQHLAEQAVEVDLLQRNVSRVLATDVRGVHRPP
jgi:hypothetical protein